MWFLIEVQDHDGIGKYEQQRFLINEHFITFKRSLNYLNAVDIVALGTNVHPATSEVEPVPDA